MGNIGYVDNMGFLVIDENKKLPTQHSECKNKKIGIFLFFYEDIEP
jgi:hypothetical protein